MNTVPRFPGSAGRASVIAALILVEITLCLNTANSAVAKEPLFFLGALGAAGSLLCGCAARSRITLPVPAAQALILLHVPLFVISALSFADPVYTGRALLFGLSSIVFFFAGSALFPSAHRVLVLTGVIAWLSAALSAAAAVQVLFGERLPLDFHSGTGGRVSSLLGNAEYFGTYLVLTIPLMIARALRAPAARFSAPLRWGLAALMILALSATQSRSGILGCVASLVVFSYLASAAPRARRWILATGCTAALGIVTVTVIRPDIGTRIWESAGIHRGTSIARRLTFWQGGLEAFGDHPLSGNGIGSFERTLFAHRSPDYWVHGGEDVIPHAHNEYLEVAVEFGIPGLMLLAGSLALILRAGIRASAKGAGRMSLIAAALVGGLAGAGVDGLASVSLRQPPVAILAWLFMGLLVSPAIAGRGELPRIIPLRLPGWTAPIPLLAALIGIPFIVSSGLDSIRSDTHLLRAARISDRRSPGGAAEYRVALSNTPRNLQALSGLTLSYLDQGRWSDALESSGEIERLSPHYPKIHMMKAYALLGLGRPGEALSEIQTEETYRSHPEAYALEAAVYRSVSDTAGERSALSNLLRGDIRGGIPYSVQAASARLAKLCATGAGERDASALLDSVAGRFGPPFTAGSEHGDRD
jgi:O-antigen ligase